MPLTRAQKEGILAKYREEFGKSQALIFADYRGMTVAQLTALRNELRGSGNGFIVVKNTLARKALEEAGCTVPDDMLVGPIAVGMCFQDIATVAKILNKVAADTKVLTVKGALLGKRFVDAESAKALSDMPSREVLLAQVIGTMQAPISGLVNVLAGTMRGLLNVLNARKEQLAA